MSPESFIHKRLVQQAGIGRKTDYGSEQKGSGQTEQEQGTGREPNRNQTKQELDKD